MSHYKNQIIELKNNNIMKKFISLTICLLCATLFSFSQDDDDSGSFFDKLTFGIKAGPTFTTSGKGTDATGNGARTEVSFHFGGVAELSLSDNLSVQTEVLYWNEKSKVQNESQTFEASYIQVPVLLKYYLFNGFSVEAGPQFGFLLSSDFEIDTFGSAMPVGELGSIDFRFTTGLAYKFNNGINVGGRYDIYISDAKNEDIVNTFDVPISKFRNGVISAYVGFFF